MASALLDLTQALGGLGLAVRPGVHGPRGAGGGGDETLLLPSHNLQVYLGINHCHPPKKRITMSVVSSPQPEPIDDNAGMRAAPWDSSGPCSACCAGVLKTQWSCSDAAALPKSSGTTVEPPVLHADVYDQRLRR